MGRASRCRPRGVAVRKEEGMYFRTREASSGFQRKPGQGSQGTRGRKRIFTEDIHDMTSSPCLVMLGRAWKLVPQSVELLVNKSLRF